MGCAMKKAIISLILLAFAALTLAATTADLREDAPDRYVVQSGEYAFATHTNERTAGSYFPHNFIPLAESNRFDFIEGDREIVSGIRSLHTPGHTPWHQSLLLESGGERALYLGDLIPTTAHLPLPWIMGYDVEPLVTLETKRRILSRATAEEWLLIFEHDAKTPWGFMREFGVSK